MVLVYVITVITMEYTISYREICHLVNRSCHTSVLYRPKCWQLPNTALNIYYSSRLFSSIKTQSRYKWSQPHASMHPNMYFFVSKMFVTSITNRRCQLLYITLPKSAYYQKTLLWLTEIDHISFAPLISNKLQLTRDKLHQTQSRPPNSQTNSFFVPIRKYHRLLQVQNGKPVET